MSRETAVIHEALGGCWGLGGGEGTACDLAAAPSRDTGVKEQEGIPGVPSGRHFYVTAKLETSRDPPIHARTSER